MLSIQQRPAQGPLHEKHTAPQPQRGWKPPPHYRSHPAPPLPYPDAGDLGAAEPRAWRKHHCHPRLVSWSSWDLGNLTRLGPTAAGLSQRHAVTRQGTLVSPPLCIPIVPSLSSASKESCGTAHPADTAQNHPGGIPHGWCLCPSAGSLLVCNGGASGALGTHRKQAAPLCTLDVSHVRKARPMKTLDLRIPLRMEKAQQLG